MPIRTTAAARTRAPRTRPAATRLAGERSHDRLLQRLEYLAVASDPERELTVLFVDALIIRNRLEWGACPEADRPVLLRLLEISLRRIAIALTPPPETGTKD